MLSFHFYSSSSSSSLQRSESQNSDEQIIVTTEKTSVERKKKTSSDQDSSKNGTTKKKSKKSKKSGDSEKENISVVSVKCLQVIDINRCFLFLNFILCCCCYCCCSFILYTLHFICLFILFNCVYFTKSKGFHFIFGLEFRCFTHTHTHKQ